MRHAVTSRLPVCTGSRARRSWVVPLLISMSILLSTHGPQNRSLLLSYFNNGMNDEMLDDATILGFHALEFILFRDGQPRQVAELKGNDTYKNFENVSGAQELAYAQTICTLLGATHLPVAVCLGRRQGCQSYGNSKGSRSGLSNGKRSFFRRQPHQRRRQGF